MRYWRKRAENGRKDFLKNLGRNRKSIQFGKLDQKSLFFIWFFIDNGQKTYEKIRKNWIQMKPDCLGDVGIMGFYRFGRGTRLKWLQEPSQGGFPEDPRPHQSHIWPHSNQIFPYFFIGFLTIIYKNHIKNNDFWSNLTNWIDFRVLPKIFQKIFPAIFGPFSLLSHFFDLSKLKIYLKTFIFIQQKILEARFSPPNSTFYSPSSPPTFFNFVVFRTYVTQFKWGQRIQSPDPEWFLI